MTNDAHDKAGGGLVSPGVQCRDAAVVNAWRSYLQANSNEAGAWVDLAWLIESSAAADDKLILLDMVSQLSGLTVAGRFFRAMFLLLQTLDLCWATDARAALCEWAACSAARRWRYVAFVWSLGVIRAFDSGRFRALLARSGLAEIIAELGGQIAVSVPAPVSVRVAADSLPRVAVVAAHLASFPNAGTRIAIEHAALLGAAGCDVAVFSAQEMQSLDMTAWLGLPFDFSLGRAQPETWKAFAGEATFQVHIPYTTSPLEARWQQSLLQVQQFEPDVVLFVGFLSPLQEALWRRYPVAAISLHAQPPMTSMDVWLHQFTDGVLVPSPWLDRHNYLLREYPYRLPWAPAQLLQLTPLALPDNARLVVTVGYRLSSEVSADWSARVLQRLAANPDWVWLLVGEGKPIQGIPTEHPQIRVLPHQDNIGGLLANCSLYLNPPRVGGGFSVLEAMAVGVPVVAHAHGDGGNKLGRWAAGSTAEYWEQVDSLMGSEGERLSRGRALSERFHHFYNLSNATPVLLEALQAARQQFVERSGKQDG